MKTLSCTIILSALFSLVFLSSASQTEDLLRLLMSKSTGKVSIQALDAVNLQATYSRRVGHSIFDADIETIEGVRIETEVNNDVERVKIQSLNDKEIVSYHHLPNEDNEPTLISIMGQSFVTTKESNGDRKEYHVPEVFSEGLSQVFSQGEFDPGYLKLLDSHGVESVRVAAIQEMLAGQEIPLMREAVEAIGQRGITGKDNPSALPAMMMVMRFSALRDEQMKKNEANSQFSLFPFKLVTDPSQCTLKEGEIKCPNSACCTEDRCPGGPETECKGMCGRICTCWPLVCGDCCKHPGCFGHDNCCEKHGMASFQCLFILQLRCGVPYVC